MTFLQAAEALLEEEWTETISGRARDVPKPEIVVEKEVTKDRLQTQDSARIIDGGDTAIDPRGFGWTHERIEPQITIELRTADRRVAGEKIDGRIRLFGERDGLSEPDRHVGLAGETKRILDSVRKGFAEFDLVVTSPLRDMSSNEGTNIYRADVDLAFIQHASSIDPSV